MKNSCIKLDQFSFYRCSYFVTHKLPMAYYRHCARRTDEVHTNIPVSVSLGHLGLHAQWSSTFLKLHVTGDPAAQQEKKKEATLTHFFLD